MTPEFLYGKNEGFALTTRCSGRRKRRSLALSLSPPDSVNGEGQMDGVKKCWVRRGKRQVLMWYKIVMW